MTIKFVSDSKKNLKKIIFIILIVSAFFYLYKTNNINLISVCLVSLFFIVSYRWPDYTMTFLAIIYAIYLPGYIFEKEVVYVNLQLLSFFLIVYSVLIIFLQLLASNEKMIKYFDELDSIIFFSVSIIMIFTFYSTVKIYGKEPSTPPSGFVHVSSSIYGYKLLYSVIGIFPVLLESTMRKINKIRGLMKMENESLRGKVSGKMKKNQ